FSPASFILSPTLRAPSLALSTPSSAHSLALSAALSMFSFTLSVVSAMALSFFPAIGRQVMERCNKRAVSGALSEPNRYVLLREARFARTMKLKHGIMAVFSDIVREPWRRALG